MYYLFVSYEPSRVWDGMRQQMHEASFGQELGCYECLGYGLSVEAIN